jgi:hypothetical protein
MSDNDFFDEEHAMDLILNNMVNELRKVRVRFANESEYIIIENFDLSKFEIQKEFDYDFYGLYKGNHAMVNKEDFKNCV